MNAHAVVFTAPPVVEYREVHCPDPGPGDVVVHVTHSWISNGTEGSFLRGERIAGDTAYRFPASQAAQAWRLIESKQEPVLGVILDWSHP